ncbi:MAG: glycosyl transferase [Microcystaceae cyanobacterium]
MIIYFAITGHGFGHAVRISSLAAAIKQRYPDALLILVTKAPRWLLESYIQGDFIHRPRAFDVGVIQSDSLTMDKAATKAKMAEIRSQQSSLIAAEVNFIRTNKVNLVIGDIPALAAVIAQKAGVPCWMMGNFGWDFIYQEWGEEFSDIVKWIQEGYQYCDRLFRLPLSEPMAIFPNITDTGLTGGMPRYSISQLREQFNLTVPTEKTVLLTFGGLGLQAIPYQQLTKFPDWQFITFDQKAPELDNLRKITDNFYRPVDFMPLVGRVISKPGFSTFSEAMRLDIPIISLTRDDFAEGKILLNGLKNHAYHQIITPETFFTGNWQFLNEPLILPQSDTSLNKQGTEEMAEAVIDFLS